MQSRSQLNSLLGKYLYMRGRKLNKRTNNSEQQKRTYMGVSENGGTPKSPILIGFSIINHPFWGFTIFGNTHIFLFSKRKVAKVNEVNLRFSLPHDDLVSISFTDTVQKAVLLSACHGTNQDLSIASRQATEVRG